MSAPIAGETRTPASVRALLTSLIDYAGLFPPADLDMAATVRNYASYLATDDAWMLERLIVPVKRLDEFETHAAGQWPTSDDDEPWPLSALTAPAGDPALADDLARIAAFNQEHADAARGLVVVDAIELKAVTPEAIESALDAMPDELFPFFELPVAIDPRGLIAALAGGDAGAKIRSGGVQPELYPSAADVARFLAVCAAADVPFKATAALHHPFRHHSDAVGVKEFGFVGFFVAATLALYHELPEDELASVLGEESIDAFAFDDDGARWRGRAVSTDQIEDARLSFAVSFGSCSFDEPREDLRALGLL